MTTDSMKKVIGALAILAVTAPALASDVSEDQPIEYSPRRVQIAAFERESAAAQARAAPAPCTCQSHLAGAGSGEPVSRSGPAAAAQDGGAKGMVNLSSKVDEGGTAGSPAN
jgi:hypothetical protein